MSSKAKSDSKITPSKRTKSDEKVVKPENKKEKRKNYENDQLLIFADLSSEGDVKPLRDGL